jgi:transcriptional regulator with XRE-family HTH domain
VSITSDKFAKGLRYYRKKRGLTALALSRALDISHATISRWEASGPLPDGDTMDKICAILGIQIEDLFSTEKSKVDSKPKQLVLEDALEIVKKNWQHLQLKTKPRN